MLSNLQSVIARGLLAEVAEKSKFLPLFMNFSAQTTSKRVQENIEGKLEKRGKTRSETRSKTRGKISSMDNLRVQISWRRFRNLS